MIYIPHRKTKSAKFHIVQQQLTKSSEHVYDSDASVGVNMSMIDDTAPSINILVNYVQLEGLLGHLDSSFLDCFDPYIRSGMQPTS